MVEAMQLLCRLLRTAHVWSLSSGRLLRNIVFPSIIDAIALDPGEHVFYAGGQDGKIYIAALNDESSPSNSYGLHIIGSLSDHSKPVTCLAYSTEGNLLLSGSEDGMIRVWDVKTQNVIHMFRHAKGPVDNILIVRHPLPLGRAVSKAQASARHEPSLPPPLEKYANSTDEDMDNKTIITLPATSDLPSYLSSQLIDDHIKELQQQGSSAAAEMEVKRLKLDRKRSMQMVQQLKFFYDNLQEFCVTELLDEEQMGESEGNSL